MKLRLGTELLTANSAAISAAAGALARGGLVAFPAETDYRLGADATDGEAVARLHRAMRRRSFEPLIAYVADLAAAQHVARFNGDALALTRAFWPGALTLVLPRTDDCPVADLVTAGLDSITTRVPAAGVAQGILKAFGRPMVAPSAAPPGQAPPGSAQQVMADLDGCIDIAVDGGPAKAGTAPTVVACVEEPILLRSGGIARAALEGVLGRRLASAGDGDTDSPLAPGLLASDYAPRARLRINATRVEPGEALLGFGPGYLPGTDHQTRVLHLSRTGDLVEAAAKLFRHLRAFDRLGIAAIAAMPVPEDGLGEAINDRLRRFAAPVDR